MALFSFVQMLRRAYSLCRRVFCLLLYNAAGPFASGVLKKAYFLRLPVSFLPVEIEFCMVSMLFLKNRGMGAPIAAAFSIMLPISASRYHTVTMGKNSAPGKNGSVPCGRFAAKSISSAPHFFHNFSRAVFEAQSPCFSASEEKIGLTQ